jgi:CRP-like cAMP-binding protein
MSAALSGFPLLEELRQADRETLAEYLEERAVDTGMQLFVAGEESDSLHLVVEGGIRLERRGTPLASVGKGEAIGGLGLALVGTRECSAVVEEPSRVLSLDRASYLRLRMDAPEVALSLHEALVRDFAAAVRESLSELEAAGGPLGPGEVDEPGFTD